MDAAAMFVMLAVGLHGVDMANPRLGQKVVVYGVGLIGLGVVACVHRGCFVIAVRRARCVGSGRSRTAPLTRTRPICSPASIGEKRAMYAALSSTGRMRAEKEST
jgi:hypothetical protein